MAHVMAHLAFHLFWRAIFFTGPNTLTGPTRTYGRTTTTRPPHDTATATESQNAMPQRQPTRTAVGSPLDRRKFLGRPARSAGLRHVEFWQKRDWTHV